MEPTRGVPARVGWAGFAAVLASVAVVALAGASAAPPSGASPFLSPGSPVPRTLVSLAVPPVAPPASSRLNLLLVTVDTMRPDHLGIYGYQRDTTPRLDRFASGAAVFPNAFSVSAWTFPGVVSVMTGVYPARHGYDARGRRIAPDAITLQRLLGDAGYRVPALSYDSGIPGIQALQVEDPPGWMEPEREGGAKLLQWLRSPEAREGPFFAWYHYRGLHLPYDPAPPDDTAFGEVMASPGVDQVRRFIIIPAELQAFRPEDRQAVVDLYDGELLAFDRFWGGVVDALEEAGLRDATLVVLTADHGEELLEHGLVGHASTTRYATLFDEVMRIPLLIRRPGEELSALECQVSQVDVMPTALSLMGLPVPEDVQGRDLSPALRGAPCEEGPVFAESILGGFQARGESARSFVWSVRTPEHKLVVRKDADGEESSELYDLVADPGETRNRYRDHAAAARRHEELLEEFFARHGGPDYWKRALEEAPPTHPGQAPEEVALAPRVLRPADGARLEFDAEEGQIRAEWSGSPVAQYVVEYDVGTGRYETTGRIPVDGNRLEFGPVPLDLWNSMADYNPWRFRVWHRSAPDRVSAWIEVEILATRNAEGARDDRE